MPEGGLSRLSLQGRQLLAASLGLIAFLGLTGYALDRAFTETAESALRDRLKSYTYAYFGGMDFSRGKVLLPPETAPDPRFNRSEEHTSELQSLMRNSYAVFCLKKKKDKDTKNTTHRHDIITKK